MHLVNQRLFWAAASDGEILFQCGIVGGKTTSPGHHYYLVSIAYKRYWILYVMTWYLSNSEHGQVSF